MNDTSCGGFCVKFHCNRRNHAIDTRFQVFQGVSLLFRGIPQYPTGGYYTQHNRALNILDCDTICRVHNLQTFQNQ